MDEIAIPPSPGSAVSVVWDYILLDNPLIFYVRSYVQIINSQKNVEAVKPSYELTKQTAKQYHNDVVKYLLKFNALRSKSESEKVLAIHDHCLTNFKYDYTFGENVYSILGAILKKSAVCEGIAKFVKLAFDYVGMKSMVVIGELKKPIGASEDGHAWNIVEVGGKFHHLDVTLDMTMMDKIKRYDYYNLSDKDILKDHIISSRVPVCAAYGGDYYSQQSLRMDSIEAFKTFLAACFKRGEKTIIVKMGFNHNTQNISEVIMEAAKQQYARIHNNSFEIEMRSNIDQMVFEIHFKP